MYKKFYTLDSAKKFSIENGYNFIISHECKIPYMDGENIKYRERDFIVFKNISNYIENMKKFPYSHELILESNNSMIGTSGRLVFDFDFKKKHYNNNFVNDTFESDIEDLIKIVIDKYYININLEKLIFVWLTSQNKDKYSKHLIVKNFYFIDDWVKQLKIFYIIFIYESKKICKFTYIKDEEIIDTQLARKNASLRMPYNKKYEKENQLIFDKNYSFIDGLIKIYDINELAKEQIISIEEQNIKQMKKISECNKILEIKETLENDIKLINNYEAEFMYNKYLQYNESFNYDQYYKYIGFENNIVILKRIKSGKCLICNREHDSENAYLIKYNDKIYFKCRRNNNGKILLYKEDKNFLYPQEDKSYSIPPNKKSIKFPKI